MRELLRGRLNIIATLKKLCLRMTCTPNVLLRCGRTTVFREQFDRSMIRNICAKYMIAREGKHEFIRNDVRPFRLTQ